MRIAYCPVLYGAAYFREAAAAVAPHVDKIVALYTRNPSFGRGTTLRCPDSEDQMRACLDPFGSLVEWYVGQWFNEGQHRDTIFRLYPNADTVLPFDTDEVWNGDDLTRCIAEAESSPSRNFLIQGWFHFWRSFGYACTDVWAPVRIIRPKGSGDVTLHGTVYHLGYAISPELMKFKWSCHGHYNELRPEWMNDIFLANVKNNCHPTTRNWWNAEPFDKNTLPLTLKAHPNYGKELIE